VQRSEQLAANQPGFRAAGRWQLAAALLIMCSSVFGHGPMPQRLTETIEVTESPDAVWKRVGNFADLAWHPAVQTVSADRANEPGSVRTIRLRDGGQLVESLTSVSAVERTFSYELQEAAGFPVSQLRATLSVKSAGSAGSVIEWSATFLREDRSPRPAAGQADEDAVRAVKNNMRVGLDALARKTP